MSTITVTATVEPNAVPPRVRLNVADTGSPALTSTTITRSNPDGTTTTVRTSDGQPLALTSGAGLVYDNEVQFQAAVSYSSVESPTLVTSPVTIPENRIWLIDPGVPALSMPITVAVFGDLTKRMTRGVFYPMGRSSPVVQTDGARKSSEGSLLVKTMSLAEIAALEAVTASGSPLLLNVPATLAWGVSTNYISISDVVEQRLVEYAPEVTRYFNLPYTVVDRPIGGTQAERTYADLLDFPTYGALLSAYATYGDLLAGP
jgi:hypothetical protein